MFAPQSVCCAFVLVAALAGAAGFRSQTRPASAGLPVVVAAEIPRYPDLALQARVQGRLRLRVTIGGGQVVAVEELVETNPFFFKVAVDNLRTWRFESQGPATFDTTFRFSLVGLPTPACGGPPLAADEPSIRLNYPSSVEIRNGVFGLCETNDIDRPPPPDVFASLYGVSVKVNPLPTFAEPVPPAVPNPVFVWRATVVGYPAAARAAGIEGTVRVIVMPTGEFGLLDGPPELAAPTLAAIRQWQLSLPSNPDQIAFVYKLLPGDCEGGGPVVETTPNPRVVTVTAKKTVPCGPHP
jgi:hypothetical protein